MSAKLPDVRVGSTPDGLTPISVAERSLSAGARQWAGLLVVAGSAVLADQATKHVVAGRLPLGAETAELGPFSIHHVRNTGIAFGLFSSATSIIVFLTALAVLAMLVYFARSGGRHPVLPVGLGLLLGGSLSNLVDRIRLGYVTDFLDLTWWPAFNIADACIVVGVGVLFAALAASDR